MDPYKSLLASASREHVRRQSALQTPLVGNVFLPAIQSPKRRSSGDNGVPNVATACALSMQHLKVIEQCIQAENRREAQLAQCTSVRERRHLTRKFLAQRTHERELIEALMVGRPAPAMELELLDLDPGSHTSSVGRMMVINTTSSAKDEITGLTATISSPDRVFRKATAPSTFTSTIAAKPHARKKFTLPDCHGSPGKKVSGGLQDRYPGVKHAEAEITSPPVLTESTNLPKNTKPKVSVSERLTRTRSPSRSASPVRSGSTSSTQATSLKPTQKRGVKEDHHVRIISTTRVPPLASLPTSPIARKPTGGSKTESRQQTEVVDVTNFDGVTSFAEARQLALQAAGIELPDELSSAEKETQTSSRSEINTQKWAVAQQLPMGTTMEQSGNLSDACQSMMRPHSSPVLRSSIEVESLTRQDESTADDVSDIRARDDNPMTQHELVVEIGWESGVTLDQQNEDEQPDASLPASTDHLDLEPDTSNSSNELEDTPDFINEKELFTCRLDAERKQEDDYVPSVSESPFGMVEEDLEQVEPDSLVCEPATPLDVDEVEFETDVAEVLFDLVDLLAEAVEHEQITENEQGDKMRQQGLEIRNDQPQSTRPADLVS